MFEPKEIVYGTVVKLGFYQPRAKYLITIYRDDNLNIFACFTTSKQRSGVTDELLGHGPVIKDGRYLSYVFHPDVNIGVDPETGEPFSMPRLSVITFDYGLREGQLSQFNEGIQDSKVVCRLYDEEYINLVYAMYKSDVTPRRYKPCLEKVLTDFYSANS